jgi:hypothetical protein
VATFVALQTGRIGATCGHGEECPSRSEAKDNVLLQLQGALKSEVNNASQQSSLLQTQRGEQVGTAETMPAQEWFWNIFTFYTAVSGAAAVAAKVKAAACPPGQQMSFTNTNGFYVIAHMTNTIAAVDWAITQGANGLEIDFWYSPSSILGNYAPVKTYHCSFPGGCDCLCDKAKMLDPKTWFEQPGPDVCPIMGGGSAACEASAPVDTMLHHLTTKSSLALLYADNKVDTGILGACNAGQVAYDPPWSDDNRGVAGKNFAKKIVSELFSYGDFTGDVVVGVGKRTMINFLKMAKQEFDGGSYTHRVLYTIDQETSKSDVADTIAKLVSLGTTNLVYSVGISACAPGGFTDHIKEAISSGSVQYALHWTIDVASNMGHYMDAGARGIITNIPGDLATMAQCKKKSFQNAVLKGNCFPYKNWGAPAGMDGYSTTEGSNTWNAGGARLTGSQAQMRTNCFNMCRKSSSTYKYYVLHDKTACFCAKQAPTLSARNGGKCAENEVWPVPEDSYVFTFDGCPRLAGNAMPSSLTNRGTKSYQQCSQLCTSEASCSGFESNGCKGNKHVQSGTGYCDWHYKSGGSIDAAACAKKCEAEPNCKVFTVGATLGCRYSACGSDPGPSACPADKQCPIATTHSASVKYELADFHHSF